MALGIPEYEVIMAINFVWTPETSEEKKFALKIENYCK